MFNLKFIFMELNLNDPAFIKSLVDYHWMYCFNADCPRAADASDSSRQSSNPMMLLPEMLFIPMLTSMHLVPISCVCTSSRQHGDFPISTTR